MSERQKILDTLQLLFQQAEREGKWFYCHYQQMWFSPAELRSKHKNGRFIWGKENWELRDPIEHVRVLERKVREAESAVAIFKRRMGSGGQIKIDQ